MPPRRPRPRALGSPSRSRAARSRIRCPCRGKWSTAWRRTRPRGRRPWRSTSASIPTICGCTPRAWSPRRACTRTATRISARTTTQLPRARAPRPPTGSGASSTRSWRPSTGTGTRRTPSTSSRPMWRRQGEADCTRTRARSSRTSGTRAWTAPRRKSMRASPRGACRLGTAPTRRRSTPSNPSSTGSTSTRQGRSCRWTRPRGASAWRHWGSPTCPTGPGRRGACACPTH